MNQSRREFLYSLLETPSPTGSEQAVQRRIHAEFKGIADTIEPDVHGNLILAVNPGAQKKVMLAGHCDQIGFLVKYISPDGYLYLESLGGTDSGVIPGSHLIIHTSGGPVEGIVGRKPLHLQEGSEKQQIPAETKIWLDIGANDADEAKEVLKIGDYVTFPLKVTELRNGLISSPGLDNKAGLFVCLEVLREYAKSGGEAGLFVVSTVQEEIGARGAKTATSKLSPDVGIAVDVVPATDDPGYDLPPQKNPPCHLNSGPTISTGPNTNPVVGDMLMKSAAKLSLGVQEDPRGKAAPNDSKMIQIGDSGVAAASVGIPQRNMHTQVEVVSLKDLESSILLLANFVRSVTDSSDFRPFYFNK